MRFDLGDSGKFEFEVINFGAATRDRFLIQYRKKEKLSDTDLGRFFRVSADGGKTFGKEYALEKLIPKSRGKDVTFYFFAGGISAILIEDVAGGKKKRRNLFYTRSDKSLYDWSEPSRINDEQNSADSGCHLAQSADGALNCAWQDTRSGVSQIYFSRSTDEGKTWTTNKPIEPDIRRAGQNIGALRLGAGGRLLAFWDDWRDEKTLVDVRFSYSDDDGQTWLPSVKINDDKKAVWQLAASVVVEGQNILVAFTDFREEGIEGDNDWNVYYARSVDNGASWEKNQRLNDIKNGRQANIRIVKDQNEKLYAIWNTTEKTLFGQIAFSYSKDFGETWSPSVPLSEDDRVLDPNIGYIYPIGNGRLLTGWVEESYDSKKTIHSILEPKEEDVPFRRTAPETEASTFPVRFTKGKKLFEDDFSAGASSEKWETIDGVWSVVNGEYKATRTSEPKSSLSFAKISEPEKYILEGRFRLDKTTHEDAEIYFRAGKKSLRHLVIKNRFRHGSWLSVKDNDLPRGGYRVGGRVIAQKPFPFRADRWYGFRLVVTPKQIDYYVDDRLMMSFAGRVSLTGGRLGLGSWARSPSYFDDISVYELKE